jgi:hypothetical protein
MFKKTLLLTTLFVISSLTVFSQDSEYEIDLLMKSYSNTLEKEGFIGSFDSDGDLKFKYEGKNYWILRPSYKDEFNLAYYFNNKEEGCSTKMLNIANEVTRRVKGAKAYITSDCEMFTIKFQTEHNDRNFDEILSGALKRVNYARKLTKELH